MPSPVSKIAKVAPGSASRDAEAEDLLDRTMEFDVRGLLYEVEESEKPRARAIPDDPTVVLDLNDAQVGDLLAKKK